MHQHNDFVFLTIHVTNRAQKVTFKKGPVYYDATSVFDKKRLNLTAVYEYD